VEAPVRVGKNEVRISGAGRAVRGSEKNPYV